VPLTPKGQKILANMQKQYGSAKKAKSVFYASANAGKITGVHHSPDRYDDTGTGPIPARREYHGEQDGLPPDAGKKGTPAGGTDSPRVSSKTLQGALPETPGGTGTKKWPSDVDSYRDSGV